MFLEGRNEMKKNSVFQRWLTSPFPPLDFYVSSKRDFLICKRTIVRTGGGSHKETRRAPAIRSAFCGFLVSSNWGTNWKF